MLKLMIMIMTTKTIMLNNNCKREEKRKVPERAIMYYSSSVTSRISSVVIFTNHLFSAHILHKAKIKHYVKVFVTENKLLLTI